MIYRVFDILLVLCAAVILVVPFLIVAVLLWFSKISPIFFTQERPGLNGKIFKLYKFRSMTNEVDQNGELLSDEDRLTRLGSLIRKTSLDELPSLWNVLKGEMSIVGPRPLLPEYLPLYTEMQMRRHDVVPGITGWAQVNGRNALGWEERFDLDIWFVENRSVYLYFKIIGLTIYKVLKRSDIAADGYATMQDFRDWHIEQKNKEKP